MNKKLLEQEATPINAFLHDLNQAEKNASIMKYTIDSANDDRFRLLISEPFRPFSEPITATRLAQFNKWKTSSTVVVHRRKAMLFGIPANRVKEGEVFVKLGSKTFEITEHVRQEVKSHYKSLLRREAIRKKVDTT
jgi:hypothetical protein